MLEHLDTVLIVLTFAGLSFVVLKACQQLSDSAKEAVRMYQQATETNRQIAQTSLEELRLCKFFAEDVIRSYQLLGTVQKELIEEAKESSQQAALVCQHSVEEVTDTCEEAVRLASKNCSQVLHSAFPNPALDWSWHHENSFMCHYCQRRFPMTEKESIGKYNYCMEHGTARKERLLREECGVSQS